MKDKIIKDTLIYSASTFFSKIFNFVRSIIVARFLGPSLYGLWNALSIILEYNRYTHLGVLNAMNREVPFYRGKKDYTKVREIRNTGFTVACIPSFIIGLVIVLISIFITGRVEIKWVMALRVIAILVFMRQLWDFFSLLLRSDNKFVFLSKMQILFSAVDLLLISTLVIRFGFRGFLWATALNYIWIIGYMLYRVRRRYNLRFYLNRNLLVYLAKIGILMTVIGVILSLRTAIDRLMIIRFLGVTYLGYFGISYVLIQFIFFIPSAISQIMYPRLVERYGSSNKDIGALRNYMEISTQVLAYSMPLLIGEVFLLLPFGVRLLLPQYTPGIFAAQITILGLFFFSTGMMAGNFLVTTNRLYWYLGCACVAAIINFILDYFFLKAGFGINGVALGGLLITSFIYASLVLGSVMFQYLRSGLKTFLYLTKVYFPFFYSLAVLLMLNHSALHLAVKMAIFAVACLPLFWKLEKDTKTLSLVFAIIRDNIKMAKV